jgi:uncharacterized protein YcfJ
MSNRTFRRALIATALIAATTTALAAPRGDYESMVRARVISSAPVFQTVNEPKTECWSESVAYESRRRHEGSGGAVVGAIAGGLLGSTVGKGNGRVAAAAIGAATGAVVGDRIDSRYERAPRQVERCQTTDNLRRVVNGYDVRYRYQGREYATHLPYDPGKYLNLRVSFEVAEDQRYDAWNQYSERDEH